MAINGCVAIIYDEKDVLHISGFSLAGKYNTF
jgi:hypothetical protein